MIESKYYKTWEQYMAEHPEISEREEKAMSSRMQTYEEMMFGFVMFLLI
ncbi:MAG: hypothetical protein GX200_02130 [Firmicutes bacterium]|nr:hypothetical protein [Bacillota bacterium]